MFIFNPFHVTGLFLNESVVTDQRSVLGTSIIGSWYEHV